MGFFTQSGKDEHIKYYLRQLDIHMEDKSSPHLTNKTVANAWKILIFRKIIKILEDNLEDVRNLQWGRKAFPN